MTWSMIKQQHINPDFDMIARVVSKLNGVFDAYDIYHHSAKHRQGEMFEYTYQTDSKKREAWQITFMGSHVVATGGGHCGGLDYDDFYEDDYIFLIPENEKVIFDMAYEETVHILSNMAILFSYSDLPETMKRGWIVELEKGIARVNADKNNPNVHWAVDKK